MKHVSKRTAAPAFVEPCLAKLVSSEPSGDEWVHEVKFDGYRLQARLENGKVQLMTRSGLDWTHKFTGIERAFEKLDVTSAIIDGEAIVENDAGVSDFAMLVGDLKSGVTTRIVYCAFDLLHLNGDKIMQCPLIERKNILQALLRDTTKQGKIRFSQHIAGSGAAMFEEACKLGLEGIVSKRIDLPYHPGRRGDWLKTKCIQTDEFIIAGYLPSTVLPKAIGALALGYNKRNRLIYAGRVGTGFDRNLAVELWQQMQPRRAKSAPFSTPLDSIQRKGVHWVQPSLVAQVEYRGWTHDKLLRHASFKGIREDKPASQVTNPDSNFD